MATTTRFLTNELPSLAGMAGAALIRSSIVNAYESRKGAEPPTDPSRDGVTWREAVVWTAVLAVGAAVGRLVVNYAVGETVNRTVAQRQRQDG